MSEDEDKIRINIMLAGMIYPLTIKRSDEEIYRKAARQVEIYINRYKERYPKVTHEMALAMVAYHFSLESLVQQNRNDTTPFTDKIRELNSEMDTQLNG